jgi:hypothetical protein
LDIRSRPISEKDIGCPIQRDLKYTVAFGRYERIVVHVKESLGRTVIQEVKWISHAFRNSVVAKRLDLKGAPNEELIP